mgnify:CR=1 FL=1
MIPCRNCDGSGFVNRFTVWVTIEYSGHEYEKECDRFNSLEEAIQWYKDRRYASRLGYFDEHIIRGKIVDESTGSAVREFCGWDRVYRTTYPTGRYQSEYIGELFSAEERAAF